MVLLFWDDFYIFNQKPLYGAYFLKTYRSQDQGVGVRLALFSIIILNNSITNFFIPVLENLGFGGLKVLDPKEVVYPAGNNSNST